MAKPSIPYVLRRGEAPQPGLLRILKTMGERARTIAAKPESDLADSIHEMRTLMKRLRAYLWFLRQVLGQAFYTKSTAALRKAARQFSQARDLEVIAAALVKATVPGASTRNLEALAQVSQAFAQHQASERESDRESRDRLRKVAAVVVHWAAKTTKVAAQTRKGPSPEQRMHRASRATRKVAKTALRKKDPRLAHEWRKKTKRLLYVLQLTQGLPPPKRAGGLEKIDELQKILGEHQDCVVAEKYLRRGRVEADATEVERAIGLLKKKRAGLLKDARKRWRSVLREL